MLLNQKMVQQISYFLSGKTGVGLAGAEIEEKGGAKKKPEPKINNSGSATLTFSLFVFIADPGPHKETDGSRSPWRMRFCV